MTAAALITGASQGIGNATAHRFAKEGYRLILAARQSDRLEAAAQELSQQTEVLAVPTDVKDPEQVKELIQKGLSHFGTIDVLINNAGICASGTVEHFSLEDWHQILDTNLWGYIHTTHEILPHFLERRTGSIVNVVSIGGKVPTPYMTPYVTSKYALTGMTESLHSELADKGIHVSGIYPNLIKSSFVGRSVFRGKDQTEIDDRRQQFEQFLQNPAVEKPEDVANAIWDAVKHRKAEVVVGSANLSVTAQRFFPAIVQWAIKRSFQKKGES